MSLLRKAGLFGLALVVPSSEQKVVAAGKAGAYCAECQEWFPRDTVMYQQADKSKWCARCEPKRRAKGLAKSALDGLLAIAKGAIDGPKK